jgi:glycine oxidase
VATEDTASDVVIVGAGVIGLAAAWRLSQQNLNVTVVDPAPARAASRAAAGMLAPVTEVKYGEEELLALGIESLRRYPSFVTDLETATGHDVGLRTDGMVVAATDAGDRALLTDLHEFQRALGLDSQLLTSRECRALESGLSPEVRCGLHVRGDFSVDNRRLCAALLAAVEARGSVRRDAVTSVNIASDKVRGVRLRGGAGITSPVVVVAAGPWSGQIGGIPGHLRPQVRPVKGEILRLRTRPASGDLPTRTIRGVVNGHEVYLVPRADGELVVGATVEEAGFDTTVRTGAVRELLRDARAVFPAVDELELVETFAAHRPGSPDNRPIVGSTDVEGLVLATGHYRNGILLTPITADLVVAAVTDTEIDADLATLVSPQRFATAPA